MAPTTRAGGTKSRKSTGGPAKRSVLGGSTEEERVVAPQDVKLQEVGWVKRKDRNQDVRDLRRYVLTVFN
jgi:hypothetical protein